MSEGAAQAEAALDQVRKAHEWQCDCESDDPCRIRAALDGAPQAERVVERVRALADDLEEGAGGDRTIEWAVGRIRAALDGTS